MTNFSVTTQVKSGVGSLNYLKRFSNKKIWVICDGFLADGPLYARLENILTQKNEVILFGGITPDPDIEMVVAGIAELEKVRPQIIIGFGGGSAIDAAKAIYYFATQQKELKLALELCIAIPTTSGTGSEVSCATVISDKKTGKKFPIFDTVIYPDVAILDPELTTSLPKTITANTGMDVLTHAIEAFVSVDANDFTDALAEKAAHLVFQYLPTACSNGKCLATREKMHNASAMAGMAFSNAGLGLNHAIAHQLGGQFKLAHGLVNSLLLPHVIRCNAKNIRARKRYARLAKYCQLCPKSINDKAAVNQLIFHVCQLQRKIHIKNSLRACNLDNKEVRAKIPEMITAALSDSTIKTNPYTASENEIKALIEAVL
ncbi:MAG: 1-propanol dehydrogenase PduQ [Shewanella sp.]